MGLPNEPWVARHRVSIDDYYRMAEAGVIKPHDRVELIEGEIIDMAPMGSRHIRLRADISHRISLAVGDQAIVRAQGPLRIPPASEPEPDVCVATMRPDRYDSSHPTPDDVLLLVEVADSSLRLDRDIKVPLYAEHGVPEVWLVDAVRNEVTVYLDPRDGRYEQQRILRAPAVLVPTRLPQVSIDLAWLLIDPA